MNCPDWAALVRAREAGERDPAGWWPAIRHLDSCAACRQRAPAEDPLLVFRRLQEPDRDVPPALEAEVAAMCRDVRAVVHSRSLESRTAEAAWPRIAAATLFLGALLLLGAELPPPGPPPPEASTVEIVDRSALLPASQRPDLPSAALVEGLDRPRARVYEMRRQGVSVVMIVDDTLDV